MRRSVRIMFFLALLVALVVPLTGPAGAAGKGRYIVVLRAGTDPSAVAGAAGVTPDYTYRHALRGFAGPITADQVRAIRRQPSVTSVVRDREVSLQAQTLPTGIDRIDADLSSTAAIDGDDHRVDADIAIIDTGVDLEQPDLNEIGRAHV